MAAQEASYQAGSSLHSVHPKSIPNALKVQQEAIAKLQRTVRRELQLLQSEELIIKLMIKREKQRLAKQQQKQEEQQRAATEGAAQHE